MNTLTVACPHCKKPVPWTAESLYKPFCSERCRIIDLGAWADGSYAIPSEEGLDPDELTGIDSDPNPDNSTDED